MNNFTTKIDWEILYNQGSMFYGENNMCECGFPIDPTNEIHPPGSECICDVKNITTLATTTTQRLYTDDNEGST